MIGTEIHLLPSLVAYLIGAFDSNVKFNVCPNFIFIDLDLAVSLSAIQ